MRRLITRMAGPIGLLITLGLALLVAVLLLATTARPVEALGAFFTGAFSSRYAIGNMLAVAAPLILGGLGIAISFQASVYNLGGEGQIYASGLIAVVIAIAVPQMGGLIGRTTALTSACAAGVILAGVPGLLRMRWGTNELISSYLISAGVILVVDYLITGPLADSSSNLMATVSVGQDYRMPALLAPSALSSAFVVALVAAVAVAIFLDNTRWGYELRLCGTNARFAMYGGINVGLYLVLPMILSGALHGLAGGVVALGTYQRAIKGFSVGLGWNSIAVALIARRRPLAVVPAALFYAYLDAGARTATLLAGVSYEIVLLVQGVIFYLVTAQGVADFIATRPVARGRA